LKSLAERLSSASVFNDETKEEDAIKNIIPENFQATDVEGAGLVETLSDDDNFAVVEKYMSQRFGMDTSEYDKEEIIDDYVNQMRRFNSGQSVVTIGEITFLNSGDEGQLTTKRKAAQDAYKLFDSMDGAFSENRTFAEKADAVYDYARAMIIDPVNLVSLGVGKIFTQAASKAAVLGAKELAFRAGRMAAFQEGKKRGKTAIGKKTLEKVQREATQRAYQEALKKSNTKAILDKADKKGIYGALGFDMVSAGALDVTQQKSEVISGYKGEIDAFQTGISSLTGALGGVTQLGLVALKNKKQIPLASIQLHRAAQVKQFKDLQKLSSEEVNTALADLKNRTAEWARMVREGKQLKKVSDDPKASLDFETEFTLRFFIGSEEESWDGLATILSKAGYTKPKDTQVGLYFKQAIDNMSPENKKLIEESYDLVRGASDQLKDFSLEDFININAAEASEAGTKLNVQSQISKRLTAMGIDFESETIEQSTKALLDPIPDGIVKRIAKKTVGEKFISVQENLVRAIITHPGTTGLNIIGWKSATINQSVSDMLRAALYGGGSVWKALTGDSVNALKYKNLSVQMMDLQRQKVRNMVDPYGTYESVMDYLAVRPDAQKKLFRYINGGVELKGILDEFELNPKAVPKKNKMEKVQGFFETAYGVKAQDFLTKTQEFHYALDKEIRIKYGKSYHEFMNDPDLVGLLSERGSAQFKEFAELEARAVDNALRNTFSKKYGGQDGLIQQTANVIEEVRSVPGLGALAPFGQFWNNSVAYLLDHSGLSLLNKYTLKAGGKAVTERDSLDLLTKTAVGYGAVAIAAKSQMENLENGLAWFEDRDDTGAVRNFLYDYPRNVPMLIGRMIAHQERDGSIPNDLVVAFGDNFGTRSLVKDMGGAFGIVSEGIAAAAQANDGEFLDLAVKFTTDMSTSYTSGFTRALDPINQVVAMARGEDYKVVDKKEGSRFVNESMRYFDQIFDVLSSDDVKENMGRATTEKEQPLTREAGQVPIGRIFGYREVLPSTTIQKLFNDIGKPQWKTDIKSKSPEAVNVFNTYVRPRIELYADFIIDSGQWDGLSLIDKQDAVNGILAKAKSEAQESLKRSINPEDKKTQLIFSVKKIGRKVDLQKALDYFKISEKDMWTLDVNQLLLVEDFIENSVNNRERQKEDLGLN
tara:strand:- start:49 stop:3534 length:3486 start_codon:yes stop_codon:yes gene_type:complete